MTAFTIASRSIGLIVCILMTRTLRPSFSASVLAAFSACRTAMPQQMIVKSVPSLIVIAFPIS